MRVEVRARPMDLDGIRLAVPLEDLRCEARVDQQHVARLHDHVVGRHDLFEHLAVDAAEVVAEVIGHVDEHAASLHAVERHLFQTEMVREAEVAATVACRVFLRADEVDARAVSVVVNGLFDAVAVGVELGARVGERVPLRRILQ